MKKYLFLILAVLILNLRPCLAVRQAARRRLVLLLLAGGLQTLNCHAQTLERQVISSSGGEYSNTSLQFNFTICEAVVQTFQNSGLILTQGFQQPSIVNCNDTVIYNYSSICSGDSIFLGGMWQTTAGIYHDTLQTSAGCDSIVITTLSIIPLPVAHLGNDTTICANASITLTATGNTNCFYHWNNGLTGSAITVSNSGVYSVTVTNSYGCSANDNITVTKYSPIQIVINAVNTICGQNMGSATALVTGGTLPYNYLWSNGDTTDVALNLASGIYILYITDLNHCQNSATALISTTNGPNITVQNVTNVSCNGGSDGAISINVTGGAQPYHFEWSNGDTINQNISNLAAGPYEIIVTDNAGCQAVRSINITQPGNISISIITTDATCGNADGSASATVTGGTQPYSYSWSNDSTSSNIQHLTSNIYTLTVTDAHSCIATNTTAITETGAPTVTIDSVINATCSAYNGAI
ncbi:MAG: SprB repeat-containing protein, partial [Bacteroidia bacterium]|nr:SprB repeat-containing protein [Bacteroidia bacterium]